MGELLLVYLLAFAVIVVAVLLAFGAVALLHLHGTAMVILVVVILIVGLAAAACILLLHFRSRKQALDEGEDAGGSSDIDILLSDAKRKLRTSQRPGPKTLSAMPLIYVLGESNSAKTTLVLRSGLDPELLAGAAPKEGDTSPTPLLNLWFTRQAAILEAGEAVRQSDSTLARLIARTLPKAYRSTFGSQAPARAAVVCVSAEHFLSADASTATLKAARTTGIQLREISRRLGSALPVYVIVTKLDRVSHFPEFVRNLSNEEAGQVLGCTLARSEASAGVYTDIASREIDGAFESLAYSLSEFRVEMLDRENEPSNGPGVYEFPREFGKLRRNLAQYLVELCKPSQLSKNPYLRGFYFTGVRARVIEQGGMAPAAPLQTSAPEVGATRMFSMQDYQAASRPAVRPTAASGREPQWTFLPRLFPEVILGDRSALSATQQTAPARLFRRVLFGTLTGIFVIFAILLLVSYINNSSLEGKVSGAARLLPTPSETAITSPSLADLHALDDLRKVIVQLDGYQQDGPPWDYRFGLYQGDKLAVRARQVYFERFRPMLLNSTQKNFLSALRALPDKPAANTDFSSYEAAYNPLRAYLITAGNHDKSDPKFLTPVFLQYWMQGSAPSDSAQEQLARQQIDFYGSELRRQDPYAISADAGVVAHAREYLANFVAETHIYQAMLTAADKSGPPIDFNRQFPGSAASVVDSHIVRGAFTHDGFAAMQDSLQHIERYMHGETWVLGDQASQTEDSPSVVSQKLTALYSVDFIQEWHKFLLEARVISCGGLHDASAKLDTLAAPGSPLLALFYTVSHNTAVADPQIKAAYQPAQIMADPNSADHLIGSGNKTYIDALLALAGVVGQVAQNPAAATDPNAGAPILAAAENAETSARQTAEQFSVTLPLNTAGTVQALMLAPIKCAEGLAQGAGKAGVNGAGQRICGALSPLVGKFPFSPNSTTQASLAEVSAVFAPDTGTLWAVYNANLKPLLVQQGGQYVPTPGAPLVVTPAFAQFFSRLAHISSGLYAPAATSPAFSFTLRAVPSKGIENATLVVDGQRIASGAASQTFNWNSATARQASLAYNSAEALQFTGPWALFQLAEKGRPTRGPGGAQLEFPLDISGVPLRNPDGTPEVVRFELSGPGAEFLVPPGLSGLRCVAPVVK